MKNGIQTYVERVKSFSRNARLVLVYSFISGVTFGVFRLLFNFYVISLNYDERFAGILTSLGSLAGLIMALPAAYIAERFMQKRVMIITGVISTVAYLGFASFPFQLTLLGFNFIAGLAQTAGWVAVSPFLMKNTSKEERQYVFSLNFGFMTLAGFIGNILGGWLPTLFSGMVGVGPQDTLAYQITLGSMMGISLLTIAPLVLLRDSRPDSELAVEMPWVKLWRHGSQLSKLIIPNLILGLGAGLMMPFMGLFYRNVFGLSDGLIGTIFMVDAIVMFFSQSLGPMLSDRIGKIGTCVLTQALSVPFLLMLGVSAWVVPGGDANVTIWLIIAIVAYLFRLGLMNLGGPIYQTFVLEQVEEDVQALAASLNGLTFTIGWVFMPALSGWLQVTFAPFGFVPIFFTTATLYITATTLLWVFFRHAGKPAPRPVSDIVILAADGAEMLEPAAAGPNVPVAVGFDSPELARDWARHQELEG